MTSLEIVISTVSNIYDNDWLLVYISVISVDDSSDCCTINVHSTGLASKTYGKHVGIFVANRGKVTATGNVK